MLLYFNGDSFVQGTELADETIPGYPGYIPWPLDFDKNSKFTKGKVWLDSSHSPGSELNKYRMEHVHEITQAELYRAYPNKVHLKTGLPFINRAHGGASMDRIVRVTITDLVKLKKENPDDQIMAFIGTTYPERSEIPNNNPVGTDLHGWPYDWASISSTFRQSNFDDMIEAVRKYKVLYETDYHSLVNFYKNVIMIQDFCKANDIPLYWIATGENVKKRKFDRKYSDRLDLQMFMDYAKFEYTIDMVALVEEHTKYQNVVCPGGHFGEYIHLLTAEEIVKVINERQSS